MANTPEDEIDNYIANPFGVMQMKGLRIGRISIDEVSVAGREAAIHFQEILNAACDKTKRLRNAKDGTRYPEPLPVAHPARLLSVEIDDYLKDMDRRGLASGTIGDCGRTLGWLRKLPRQADTSKVELRACRLRNSAGVSPPSESWGRSSL